MREIKYRVWNGHSMSDCGVHLGKGILRTIRESDVLMQYTGLHDKQGVEIYEGDILKHDIKSFTPFVMEWDNEAGCWTQYAPRNTIEVIGNIYENRELLEVKK